ncbi:MAG TPA: hypothetical protein VLY03_00075 [Bacteroidota bacterium]|nr:hypothetical protein [Bacteroidota bacterium]
MKLRDLLFLMILVVLLAGCQKTETGTDESASQLTTDGWAAYSARNYATAITKFSAATNLDASYADAYNGLGWSNAKLNKPQSAVSSFSTGLTKSPNNADMNAGLAFAYNAEKNYAQSIASGLAVLSVNADWQFARDTSVSSADIHLLLAEDYFSQTSPDYLHSLQEVQVVDPAFNADVMTVAGQTALGHEIELLRSQV